MRHTKTSFENPKSLQNPNSDRVYLVDIADQSPEQRDYWKGYVKVHPGTVLIETYLTAQQRQNDPSADEYLLAEPVEPRPPRAARRLGQFMFCLLHFGRYAGYGPANRAIGKKRPDLMNAVHAETSDDFDLAA